MEKATRYRLALYILAVGVMVSAIGFRLYQLQVLNSGQFQARAVHQHQQRVDVAATRGAILDRYGRELAVSLDTESLFAHPPRVQNPQRAAKLLAPIVGLSERELRRRLTTDKPFVYLERFMSPERVAAVRELDLPLGDNEPFGLLTESKRFYPRGKLAVHVVGFATIDGDGVEGIERQLDHVLRGDPTSYLVQVDGRAGQLRRLIRAPENEPHDAVLTIDLVLQHIAERELDRAIRETGARAASAILMDPATGEILALANRPAADPNAYGDATDAERINRAVVHLYEPGSTFKFVPMAAAIERRAVRRGQRFYCENGLWNLGNRQIHDVGSHGMLSPREVLARSSNIGMVKITRRVQPEALYDAIAAFGFGRKTGVELPGERAGLLPGVPRWSSFTRDSLAFGQEIGATVLQVTSALSAIANDGVMVSPRVVRGILDGEGQLIEYGRPKGTRVISSRTASAVGAMMESVVTRGTGGRAAVAGYRIAGKSGTAQKIAPGGGYSESQYMASFGGFGPVGAPRVVGLVVLDSPPGEWRQGGQVAAPVFARIMRDALHHRRAPVQQAPVAVALDRPPAQDSARRSAVLRDREIRRGVVPDLRGLAAREAAALLAAHGYHTQVQGSGNVVSQRPPPGTRLPEGETCLVRLADGAPVGILEASRRRAAEGRR